MFKPLPQGGTDTSEATTASTRCATAATVDTAAAAATVATVATTAKWSPSRKFYIPGPATIIIVATAVQR